jgi:isochorismate synthase
VVSQVIGNPEDPMELVRDYQPGCFLLATPAHTLLAAGVVETITERDPDELSALVTKLLVESGAHVAVGALPFDPAASPHLVLPRTARWAGPPAVRRPGPGRRALPNGQLGTVTPLPAPAEYERGVSRAVSAMRGGALRKVVLARTLEVTVGQPVDVRALLENLVTDNAHGYTYAVSLPPASGAPGTLVGSSPELLLRRTGSLVTASPVAGTLARDPDPVRDRANAEALLASVKDHDEHVVVVEAVVEALRPFCRRIDVAPEPSLVSTPAVWHLATTVTAQLIDQGISALRLASALHPTPAVCGTPVELARQTIAEIEPFERGLYGGAVGWCDASGDGQWVVAIRCAEVGDRALRLFSGAGIMPASRPSLELAETTAKFRTLLRAMGVEQL